MAQPVSTEQADARLVRAAGSGGACGRRAGVCVIILIAALGCGFITGRRVFEMIASGYRRCFDHQQGIFGWNRTTRRLVCRRPILAASWSACAEICVGARRLA